MKSSTRHAERTGSYLFAIYLLILFLFWLASCFPEARLWGINWLIFFTPLFAYLLPLIVVVLGGCLVWLTRGATTPGVESESPRGFVVSSGVLATVLAISYWLLPGATHFLGDGYQLLARLSSGAAPVKEWEIGALKLEDAIFSVLSGDPNDRAFMAFRLISLVSGILFLAALLMASIKLFSRNLERLLFFLGMATGGYMLLFFGYVENYPVFVLAVLAFCLVGLLIVKGAISRWWILLPFIGAQTFHVFGVTLIPALVYLLVRPTRIGHWVGRLSIRNRALVASGVLIVGICVYFYLCSHDLLFRFAVLPLAPDRLTIPGDTLFSGPRLLDLANFVFLLIPGFPILVISLWQSRTGKMRRRPCSTP